MKKFLSIVITCYAVCFAAIVSAFDNVIIYGQTPGLFYFEEPSIAPGQTLNIHEMFSDGNFDAMVRSSMRNYGMEVGSLINFDATSDWPTVAGDVIDSSIDGSLGFKVYVEYEEPEPATTVEITMSLDAMYEIPMLFDDNSFIRASTGFHLYGNDPLSVFMDCNNSGACQTSITGTAMVTADSLQVVNGQMSGSVTVETEMKTNMTHEVDFIFGGLMRLGEGEFKSGMAAFLDQSFTSTIEFMAVEPNANVTVVPLPASVFLFIGGILGLLKLGKARY